MMEKLNKQETADRFYNMTNEYGVLDHSRSGGGHDRYYLGKEDSRKPLFLACSRAGWMCVYFDKEEKNILESNGYSCEQVDAESVKWDYRTRVNVEDFAVFLKLVQDHLGR